MKSFRIETYLFQLLGISFQRNDNIFYNFYSNIVLFLISCYPILELSTIGSHLNDLDTFSNAIFYIICSILGAYKLILIKIHREKLGIVLDNLQKGIFKPSVERGGCKEVLLIEKCVKATNYLAGFCVITSIIMLMVPTLATFLIRLLRSKDHWVLPYGPVFFLDVTDSPFYELAWFYQVFTMIESGLGFLISDILIAGVINHLITQLQVLQISIRRIVENTKSKTKVLHKRDTEQLSWSYLQPTLKRVIEHQLAIYDIGNDFEQIFNMLIMANFIGTLIISCFSAYHISMVASITTPILVDAGSLLTIAIQLFVLSYYGHNLILESEKVAEAFSDTNYVGCDVRFQKALILGIQRCQRPLKLTVGKFTDVSITSYVWVVRTSYSFYMVLRNTNTQNQ